jgi:hypothetical protein
MKNKILPVRGFLLHVTHYDPVWIKAKNREKPFSLDLALEIVDTMAEVGMNLLAIDCEDGVIYKSHPELRRPYSVPMAQLEKLCRHAADLGIEAVPKTNFSQGSEGHNLWFRPHNFPFDTPDYWKLAFEIIDELISVCKPKRFFHIGMDEDFGRSHVQYINAITTLHDGLKKRKLRPVIWNDSATLGGPYEVFAEKCMIAEKKIPKDLVQIPWWYSAPQPKAIRRLVKEGFEVWGAPGRDPEQVRAWKNDLLKLGGTGIFLTRWIPCKPANRKDFLNLIKTNGPVCSESL